MKDFIDKRWQPILAHNGLANFDALWQLKADWFEPPNERRGGWSGVSRVELPLPEGGTQAVFLKRQENHKARLWSHPVRGAATFLREFRHIRHYRACDIPTLAPVYFAMHKVGKDERAILVTEEMTGFVSMEDRVRRWLKEGAPSRQVRQRYLSAVACLLREMHANYIQHNCFFPKHVFTRLNTDGSVEARVIDLEKSRWRPTKTLCAIRDLYTLNYHSQMWSRSERLWFFKSYLQIRRLTPFSKWLWRRIALLTDRKKRILAPVTTLMTRAGVTD